MLLDFTTRSEHPSTHATYQVSSADRGLDQFGELAIISGVSRPQPSTADPDVLGGLCLVREGLVGAAR